MLKKILIILLILIVGIGAGGFYYFTENSKPVSDQEKIVEFEVLEGSSVDQVLSKLKNEGLIRNELISKFLIRQETYDTVKTGTFEVSPSMTPQEIFSVITNSDNILIDTYRMQFIDGQWAKDYAAVIANHTVHSQAEVIAYWNSPEVINRLIEEYQVLTPEIVNDQVQIYLEGYLSPNTYEFYADATLDDITKVLLDPTEKFYLDNKVLFDNNSLSVHDVFKLSSMVQFEASKPDDQKGVAAVFLNRLADGMRLESSVTVCYALYEYNNWTDCENNPGIDSPYNTYVYAGLPVGPVSNPTQTALMSVLTPISSNDYFFIADVYGDGTVYFAETYEEHLELKRQYLDGKGQ